MKLPAFVGVLALLSLVGSPLPAKETRPNVVMIVSDDQAWTDYGFMGHEAIQTPHLDRLAAESLVFTRGYVPTSLCRPSLFTMLSGRYAHEHRVTGNDPPQGTARGELLRFARDTPLAPRLLAEQGYACFQSGKWWEGSYSEGGFTAGMTHGDPEKKGRHGDEGLKIGREGLEPIFNFLKQRGDKPFFIWYAPILPHQPHTPPPRLLEKYTQPNRSPHVAKYNACVEWFDETCGALLKHLDDQGLRENTLVLYVTDNGWIQDPNKPTFAPRSKRSPYEGGVRTPILVRWPGHLKPQRNETDLASSIDLLPTMLAACGLPAPAGLPGRNLLDTAADKTKPHEAVYGEIYEHDIREIGNVSKGLLHRWGIVGDHKLIVPVGGEPELYDLKSDPHERKNLAHDAPDTVRKLADQINAWWTPP